jgi:hypothetical protein
LTPSAPPKSRLETALALLLAGLAVVERVAPAFLVFWAKSEDSRRVRAEAHAVIAEAELKGEKDAAAVTASVEGLDRRGRLDRLVARARTRLRGR